MDEMPFYTLKQLEKDTDYFSKTYQYLVALNIQYQLFLNGRVYLALKLKTS